MPKPAILIEDAGFLLCHVVPSKTTTAHVFDGTFVGTRKNTNNQVPTWP
jgi:hypothetical protein